MFRASHKRTARCTDWTRVLLQRTSSKSCTHGFRTSLNRIMTQHSCEISAPSPATVACVEASARRGPAIYHFYQTRRSAEERTSQQFLERLDCRHLFFSLFSFRRNNLMRNQSFSNTLRLYGDPCNHESSHFSLDRLTQRACSTHTPTHARMHEPPLPCLTDMFWRLWPSPPPASPAQQRPERSVLSTTNEQHNNTKKTSHKVGTPVRTHQRRCKSARPRWPPRAARKRPPSPSARTHACSPESARRKSAAPPPPRSFFIRPTAGSCRALGRNLWS